MPDRDVHTIRDLIFYQYAKLIARSAFGCADGAAAKKGHYGFVKNTFRALQSGRKNWSDILREDKQLMEAPRHCIFCGAAENLVWEHIVPRSLHVNDRCPSCDHLQHIHNQIWACAPCNAKKSTKGLYTFFAEISGNPDGDFFDFIPALLEKKYLKTIHFCHECAGTLTAGDLDGDGALTVLDLDEVVRRHIGARGG
jgi:hypothetical protein